MAGRVTLFVRFGGCDYHCSWCDSMYAVDKKRYGHEWRKLTAGEILDELDGLAGGKRLLITLSGGNPAIWDLGEFLTLGHQAGFHFALETQASIPQPWFADLDHLCLSPKPPSSGHETDWEKVRACLEAAGGDEWGVVPGDGCQSVIFKVVVMNRLDYNYAREVAERFPQYSMYLSVGSPTEGSNASVRAKIAERYEMVLDWIKTDEWFDVCLGFQQHAMIFGAVRGV